MIIYFGIAVVVALTLTVFFASTSRGIQDDDILLAIIAGLMWGVILVASGVALCYFAIQIPFRMVALLWNR